MTKSELQEAFQHQLDEIDKQFPTIIETPQEGFQYHAALIELLLATCRQLINELPETPPEAASVTLDGCMSQPTSK